MVVTACQLKERLRHFAFKHAFFADHVSTAASSSAAAGPGALHPASGPAAEPDHRGRLPRRLRPDRGARGSRPRPGRPRAPAPAPAPARAPATAPARCRGSAAADGRPGGTDLGHPQSAAGPRRQRCPLSWATGPATGCLLALHSRVLGCTESSKARRSRSAPLASHSCDTSWSTALSAGDPRTTQTLERDLKEGVNISPVKTIREIWVLHRITKSEWARLEETMVHHLGQPPC